MNGQTDKLERHQENQGIRRWSLDAQGIPLQSGACAEILKILIHVSVQSTFCNVSFMTCSQMIQHTVYWFNVIDVFDISCIHVIHLRINTVKLNWQPLNFLPRNVKCSQLYYWVLIWFKCMYRGGTCSLLFTCKSLAGEKTRTLT